MACLWDPFEPDKNQHRNDIRWSRGKMTYYELDILGTYRHQHLP